MKTLERPSQSQTLMLEKPPVWLNYNKSTKKSGPKCFHSDAKDSLPVITNTTAVVAAKGGKTSYQV